MTDQTEREAIAAIIDPEATKIPWYLPPHEIERHKKNSAYRIALALQKAEAIIAALKPSEALEMTCLRAALAKAPADEWRPIDSKPPWVEVEERGLYTSTDDGLWYFKPTHWRNPKAIHEQLVPLGEDPPIDKVAEITGNKSWSYISCDGCRDYVERAVDLGEFEPKSYCATCIAGASQAIRAEG